MSHIHNIEITNFKSIRHQKIDGCKRINVFIGYPNVGKSNVLEALSLFSIDSIEDDFSSFVRMADFTTLFFDGNVSEKSKIYINEKHRIIIDVNDDELSFAYQFEKEGTSFKSVDAPFLIEDNSDKVLIGKTYRVKDKKLSAVEGSKLSLDNNNLPAIKKYRFKKNVDYSGKEYYYLKAPNGSNLFRVLSSEENIKKEISELFKPYNLELLYDARLQEFQILKRTETGIFTIPYDLIADTLQRVIFYKTAILSNEYTALLFEEPEARMFPPYIRQITADILFDKNDNQYFITTHSPHILTEFIEDTDARNGLSVYVVDYTNGETVIKRLTDEEVIEVAQYGIDLFFNLESYLDRYRQPHSV